MYRVHRTSLDASSRLQIEIAFHNGQCVARTKEDDPSTAVAVFLVFRLLWLGNNAVSHRCRKNDGALLGSCFRHFIFVFHCLNLSSSSLLPGVLVFFIDDDSRDPPTLSQLPADLSRPRPHAWAADALCGDTELEYFLLHAKPRLFRVANYDFFILRNAFLYASKTSQGFHAARLLTLSELC